MATGEGAAKFLVFCPVHGRELGLSRLRTLANLEHRVVALELECYDGQRLVVLTGKQLATDVAFANR